MPAAKKNIKSKRTKKPRRTTRRDLEPCWAQAVADIVASHIARPHVAGQDVAQATRTITKMLASAVPRAMHVIRLLGHPQDTTECRCRAYALIEVLAHDIARQAHMPPAYINLYDRKRFDRYMNARN